MNGRQIYVIDDDWENACTLRDFFESLGGSVECYATLDAVYELAELEELPEHFICVLDHDFPPGHGDVQRMGYELANTLVEAVGREHVRIIYISGLLRREDFQRDRHERYHSITHFLEKDAADFVEELVALIEVLDSQLRADEHDDVAL